MFNAIFTHNSYTILHISSNFHVRYGDTELLHFDKTTHYLVAGSVGGNNEPISSSTSPAMFVLVSLSDAESRILNPLNTRPCVANEHTGNTLGNSPGNIPGNSPAMLIFVINRSSLIKEA